MISEEQIDSLTDAIVRAKGQLYCDILEQRRAIRAEYTNGGVLTSGDLRPYSSGPSDPQTTHYGLGGSLNQLVLSGKANLFQSTIQTISAATFPATPTIRVEALEDALQAEVEDENDLLNQVVLRASLDKAMERATTFALLSAWAGIKCVMDFSKSKKPQDRVKFVAVDAIACGWEPHFRRFKWHSYQLQASEVPKSRWPKDKDIKPEQMLLIHEVYVRQFGEIKERTVYFAAPWGQEARENRDEQHRFSLSDPGAYTTDEESYGCPLGIVSFLPPAPGFDIPQPETLAWVPIAYALNRLADKISSEAGRINSVYVYDSARVSKDAVEAAIGSPGNIASCVEVRIRGDNQLGIDEGLRGVEQALRPVEHQTVLNELLATWNLYFGLWQVVTGIGELQRGEIPGGRQTATEIQTASNNSELRGARRREAVADVITELGHYLLRNQRRVFGSTIKLKGRRLAVPDPESVQFSLRVDPVELGHLVKRGDFQNQVAGHQLITQTFQAFPAGAPAAVLESTRRTLTTLGWRDVEAFLPYKLGTDTPADRIQEFLLRGTPIVVNPDDQHDQFHAYYDRWIRMEGAKPEPSIHALEEVSAAMQLHAIHAAASRIPTQGGAGMSVQGSGIAPIGQGGVAPAIAQNASAGIPAIR